MPKLKPINFELIKNGDRPMAWRMLKDLLLLYPRGAGQKHRKEEYTVRDEYRGKNSYLSAYRDGFKADEKYEDGTEWEWDHSENWGYTDVQVYTLISALGFEGTGVGEYNISRLLRTANKAEAYNWSQAKMTRGSHRLYKRMAGAYRRAIKSGDLGDLMFTSSIRTIPVREPRNTRWGWDDSFSVNVCIPAVNPPDALIMIDTCFGHAIHPDKRYRGTPEGFKQGDATNAMLVNQTAVKQLTGKRAYWLEVIEKAKAQIDSIDTLTEAIEVYSLSAFGDE